MAKVAESNSPSAALLTFGRVDDLLLDFAFAGTMFGRGARCRLHELMAAAVLVDEFGTHLARSRSRMVEDKW